MLVLTYGSVVICHFITDDGVEATDSGKREPEWRPQRKRGRCSFCSRDNEKKQDHAVANVNRLFVILIALFFAVLVRNDEHNEQYY